MVHSRSPREGGRPVRGLRAQAAHTQHPVLLTLGKDPSLHWGLGSLHDLLQHLPLFFSHQRDRAPSPASTGSSPHPVHIVFDSVGHGEVDHLKIRVRTSEVQQAGTGGTETPPTATNTKLTVFTPSMSRPRAATSVATRMSICSSLKRLERARDMFTKLPQPNMNPGPHDGRISTPGTHMPEENQFLQGVL